MQSLHPPCRRNKQRHDPRSTTRCRTSFVREELARGTIPFEALEASTSEIACTVLAIRVHVTIVKLQVTLVDISACCSLVNGVGSLVSGVASARVASAGRSDVCAGRVVAAHYSVARDNISNLRLHNDTPGCVIGGD